MHWCPRMVSVIANGFSSLIPCCVPRWCLVWIDALVPFESLVINMACWDSSMMHWHPSNIGLVVCWMEASCLDDALVSLQGKHDLLTVSQALCHIVCVGDASLLRVILMLKSLCKACCWHGRPIFLDDASAPFQLGLPPCWEGESGLDDTLVFLQVKRDSLMAFETSWHIVFIEMFHCRESSWCLSPFEKLVVYMAGWVSFVMQWCPFNVECLFLRGS